MTKHAATYSRYRVVIDHDPDPDFSWLEQDMYDPSQPGYEPIYATEADMKAKRNPIDGEWYRNPDNHVALSMTLAGECDCCESWVPLDSLGSIDFLADSDDWQTGTYDGPDFRGLTGYLLECATDMLRGVTA